MSLGVFALMLIVAVAALCWRDRRGIFIAALGLFLGVTIAGSSGPLAVVARTAVDGVRTGLDALGAAISNGVQ